MNLDSFDSPKFSPLGRFLANVEIDWELIPKLKWDEQEDIQLTESMCNEVTALRLTPLITEDTFSQIFDQDLIKGK